ncbi:MAG TPA: sigma factor, partial [Woeseiaceae bacterium]|nr:sigma factor [Woeseiaceae bacterium]
MDTLERSPDSDVSEISGDGSAVLDGDDRALLDCLRAGVDHCYETFVRRFGSVVLATAKRYLRSEAEAADCFQDTFLAAFDGIHDFEGRSPLGAWLRGIAVKKSLMRLRTQKRRKEESIEQLLPEFDAHGNRIHCSDPGRESALGHSLDEARLCALVRAKI